MSNFSEMDFVIKVNAKGHDILTSPRPFSSASKNIKLSINILQTVKIHLGKVETS